MMQPVVLKLTTRISQTIKYCINLNTIVFTSQVLAVVTETSVKNLGLAGF